MESFLLNIWSQPRKLVPTNADVSGICCCAASFNAVNEARASRLIYTKQCSLGCPPASLTCFSFSGGDPGIVDDCSVAASDLNGVLQDLGVILSPTQTAFLIQVRFRFPLHTYS